MVGGSGGWPRIGCNRGVYWWIEWDDGISIFLGWASDSAWVYGDAVGGALVGRSGLGEGIVEGFRHVRSVCCIMCLKKMEALCGFLCRLRGAMDLLYSIEERKEEI